MPDLALTLGLGLDHADHGEAGEGHLARVASVGEQPGHVVAQGVAASLDPAMVAIGRLPPVERTRRRIAEEGFHVLERSRAVRLQGEEIVAPALQDDFGDAALGADGVDGDQGPFERQPLQKQRDGADLVRLARDRLLAEHQPLARGPSRDEMQGLAALAAGVAATRGLAVDRDQVGLRLAQAFHPGREAALEQIRIERREHVAEGIMARHAAPVGQEAAQQAQLLLAPHLDLGQVVRPGQGGAE